MQTKQLILAENIEMKFGEREVFRFDRMTVYAGEKIGLVRANGAGNFDTFDRLPVAFIFPIYREQMFWYNDAMEQEEHLYGRQGDFPH